MTSRRPCGGAHRARRSSNRRAASAASRAAWAAVRSAAGCGVGHRGGVVLGLLGAMASCVMASAPFSLPPTTAAASPPASPAPPAPLTRPAPASSGPTLPGQRSKPNPRRSRDRSRRRPRAAAARWSPLPAAVRPRSRRRSSTGRRRCGRSSRCVSRSAQGPRISGVGGGSDGPVCGRVVRGRRADRSRQLRIELGCGGVVFRRRLGAVRVAMSSASVSLPTHDRLPAHTPHRPSGAGSQLRLLSPLPHELDLDPWRLRGRARTSCSRRTAASAAAYSLNAAADSDRPVGSAWARDSSRAAARPASWRSGRRIMSESTRTASASDAAESRSSSATGWCGRVVMPATTPAPPPRS